MTQQLDPRQCFTIEEFQQIPKDIDFNWEIQNTRAAEGQFETNYTPQKIEVYFNERLTMVSENNVVVFELGLEKEFVSESTLIKVDGLVAYASRNQQVIFDQLKGIKL